MIDAGTISASLILDTQPFAQGMDGAFASLSLLGMLSTEQGGKVGTLGEMLALVGGRAYTGLQIPLDDAAKGVADSCNSISESVRAASDEVKPAAQTVSSNILTAVRGTVSGGRAIMADFGQGLINGLASKQNAIIAKARTIANSVASTMKKALGIASPSRVMRQVGRFTAEGMVIGMQDMAGEVQKASAALADNAVISATADTVKVNNRERSLDVQSAFPDKRSDSGAGYEDILSKKLDTLIALLTDSRQSIELDRRTFATLVREYK